MNWSTMIWADNGDVSPVITPIGTREIQATVGGMFGIISLDGAILWYCVEFESAAEPIPNARATKFALAHGKSLGFGGEVPADFMLYGDVLVTGPSDGDTFHDTPEWVADAIREAAS